MSTRRSLAFWLLMVAAFGCDDPRVELPELEESFEASVVAVRDAASATADCDQAADGTACGDGGALMHCLYNACVLNVCGDGIKAGDEVCDDGNQDDGDGCNSQCKDAACGNGLIDAREQCDDGNTTSGDGCDSSCRKDTTGPGSSSGSSADAGTDAGDAATSGGGGPVDSGTPPTDSGAVSMDSGSSPMDSGSAMDSSSGPLDSGEPADVTYYDAAGCQGCVRASSGVSCRTYLGFDLVTPCLDNPDPLKAERCVALYRCGLTDPGSCASDPARLVKCYCGTLQIENGECYAGTRVPDGRCVAEVYAASGCTTPACIKDNFAMPGSASLAAQDLTSCTMDVDEGCGTSCQLPLSDF